MFYVSEIYTNSPKEMKNEVQERVYKVLDELDIKYERVETDEAITMEDCVEINKKLEMKMVKTLFLCNRQKTNFYLYITEGDKKFDSKRFSELLNVPKVSFAPVELMNKLLGTKIGAATVFSSLIAESKNVQIVFDNSVLKEEFYGCSDGTTTGYMKLKTSDILNKILPYSKHKEKIINM